MELEAASIKRVLLLFDRDSDGRVFPHEIMLARAATGAPMTKREETEFAASLGEESTHFTYDQAAKRILDAVQGHEPRKELAKMLSTFDTMKEGAISTEELRAVMLNLSSVLSPPEVDKLISKTAEGAKLPIRNLIDYLFS